MALNVSLGLKTSLQQTLTPQQIQYLKLLQMPLVQFEQELQREIEENPLLVTGDEPDEFEMDAALEANTPDSTPDEIFSKNDDEENFSGFSDYRDKENEDNENYKSEKTYEEDDLYFDDMKFKNEMALSNNPAGDFEDPFDFYSVVMEDDTNNPTPSYNYDDDTDSSEYQIKDNVNLLEELERQLSLYPLTEEELLIGKHILWNVDDDGYLRIDLQDIVNETNIQINELNIERSKLQIERNESIKIEMSNTNPAYQYTLDQSSKKILGEILLVNPEMIDENKEDYIRETHNVNQLFLKQIDIKQAEKVLKIVHKLEPIGIASRNIHECLLAQANAISNPTKEQSDALLVLNEAFDEFSIKHFKDVMRKTGLNESELKDAIEVIKKFNPKPGDGFSGSESNTIIPDFIIESNPENPEASIVVNDSTLPPLKISNLYESLKRDSKEQNYNKETKQWIRSKHEDAKFIIQAVQQRKITMLKIMSAIAGEQSEFFAKGPEYIKPLVYKDIAEVTSLDISTVCRVVNNKFVQTDFGTYELKYFFSESLETADGEDVSTTVIKQRIKELVDAEDKMKPLSDEQLAQKLSKDNVKIARRTITKYREQLNIPVARLRKELI